MLVNWQLRKNGEQRRAEAHVARGGQRVEGHHVRLRGMEAQTYDVFEAGIAQTLDLVCASDAQGWFNNCGYELFQE